MYYLLYNNKYLYDVINSVMYVLMYYDIKCELVDEIRDDDRMYMIFTINTEKILPKNFIVYNFEQLITCRKWGDVFFDRCSKAKLILDYSLENVEVFKERGLKAEHMPFGWTPFHEYEGIISKKDIDVIFLGSKSVRRDSVLSKLGVDVLYRDNIFGERYDEIVNKAKFSLNIHYYEGKSILEITRIIPLICRGVIVISERSNDKYYDDKMEGIIEYLDGINVNNLIYSKNKCIRNKKLLLERLNMVEINNDKINLLKYI